MLNNKVQLGRYDWEWIFIKIPFIGFWLGLINQNLDKINAIVVDRGLCIIIDCNLLVFDYVKDFVFFVAVLFSIFYLLEKKMILTTSGLTLISLLVFSLRESSGYQDRSGILVLIFFSQLLAYAFYKDKPHRLNLRKMRILYPIQVIVACYTLSSISKLSHSGLSWFLEPGNFVLQILKTVQNFALSFHDTTAINLEMAKVQWVSEHELLVSLALFVAMMTELTCGMALINKKTRLLWGFALLFMHIGISYMMHIKITPFLYPMIFFLINPGYLILWSFKTIYLKLAYYPS